MLARPHEVLTAEDETQADDADNPTGTQARGEELAPQPQQPEHE